MSSLGEKPLLMAEVMFWFSSATRAAASLTSSTMEASSSMDEERWVARAASSWAKPAASVLACSTSWARAARSSGLLATSSKAARKPAMSLDSPSSDGSSKASSMRDSTLWLSLQPGVDGVLLVAPQLEELVPQAGGVAGEDAHARARRSGTPGPG